MINVMRDNVLKLKCDCKKLGKDLMKYAAYMQMETTLTDYNNLFDLVALILADCDLAASRYWPPSRRELHHAELLPLQRPIRGGHHAVVMRKQRYELWPVSAAAAFLRALS